MTCETCGEPLEELEAFPGGVCLDCYARTADGSRMPTADELTAMWGGRRPPAGWRGPGGGSDG
jgi:hypothetical protein